MRHSRVLLVACVTLACLPAVLVPRSAEAHHRECGGDADCCDTYVEHSGIPATATSTDLSSHPVWGGESSAEASLPAPGDPFDVRADAAGRATDADTYVPLANAQLMGYGRGEATVRQAMAVCGDLLDQVTVSFTGLDSEGVFTSSYPQAGSSVDAYVEVTAYFTIIRCKPAGRWAYYECRADSSPYDTQYARVSCFGGSYGDAGGGCDEPTSITLDGQLTSDDCPFWNTDGWVCSGVYGVVDVSTHAWARGEASAGALAQGAIGSLH